MSITKKISNLIEKIDSLSGRIEKTDTLVDTYNSWDEKEKKDFEEFLEYVFRVDYSYGVTYDVNWVWPVERTETTDDMLQLTFIAFDGLRTRAITGNTALEAMKDFFENSCSKYDHHVAKMIMERTLDCGIDKKTILKLFPKILPFAPAMMKCEPADEKTLKKALFPGMLQLKIDAMRVNSIHDNREPVTFFTFNGTEFKIESEDLLAELSAIAHHLSHKYGHAVALDGELVVYQGGKPLPRKKSNGQANRILKDTAPIEVHENVHIVLWDVIPLDDVVRKVSTHTNHERFDDLKHVIGSLNLKYVTLVEHYDVNNQEEVDQHIDAWINLGEEGGVFKNRDAKWEGKRSQNCIKFKAERECDLRVTGWNPGKPGSKYEGMIGSFVCGTDDGGIIVDVSGMSDDDRASDPQDWMGSIVAVLFNEVITKEKSTVKSLFLPRIIEKRFDKDETDTTAVVEAAKGRKKR